MIDIKIKEECSGCAACANICPQSCIVMADDEEGFIYPRVDREICVDCHLCEKVCPIKSPVKEYEVIQEGYVVQNKDEKILQESTSGGAFTAIAKYVLTKGGIVYGAYMDSNFDVMHIGVENVSELSKFRGSKYVQSNISANIFIQIKQNLDQGRYVCFSGTPCQVEGLLNYLQHDYSNLVTVDISCRAVPSKLVFHKYLEYMSSKLGRKIERLVFRNKYYGYKYSTLELVTEDGRCSYHHGIESDAWLRTFFSNICDRPSCYSCKFKKRYRRSDFTIWDCFPIERFAKELDNDKGVTRVLIHTEKGRKAFKDICNDLKYRKIEPESLLKGCKEIYSSVSMNPKREQFMHDAISMGGKELFGTYFPDDLKVRVKHFVRVLCVKLRIYVVLRRLYVKLTNKY